MSGGRVELGLGAGWYDAEHAAYGIPFPPTGDPLRDARGAARDPHRACGRRPTASASTSTGTHYQVVDSPALPKPVQRPRPPIIIGGVRHQAHASPRRDVRRRVQPAVPAARLLPRPRATSSAPRARPPDAIPRRCATRSRVVTCVGARRSRVRASRRPRSATTPDQTARERARRARSPRSSNASDAFGDAGAETVYLQILDLDDLDHLRLIAAEVAPHV